MNNMDVLKLDEQYMYREENMKIANRNKTQEILKYFYVLSKRNGITYEVANDLWESLCVNYQNLCNHGLEKEIRQFMKSNNANKDAFIYEYIHILSDNANKEQVINEQTGELSIEIENRKFLFAKADNYFKNTKAESIFKRKLEKECFDRTLDLVSIIENSEAVVSYLPNLFVGGYYHAYLKCPNGILVDPASNLVMLNENAKQLLDGDIVFSFNENQLEQQLKQLKTVERIELYDCPKLLQLALFKECSEIEQTKTYTDTVHKRR